MKKVLLLFAVIFMSTLAYSKGKMQVVIDYTNGIYRGFLYERIQIDEEDFIKDKPRYEGRFMDGLLASYAGVAYFPEEVDEAEDVVKINILQVTNRGFVTAEVTYGGTTVKMEGRGGVFGSFLNLFGDGMKNLGREVGLWLNKYLLPA